MSYIVQIKIHQTNIYRGYLVLYQEGADQCRGQQQTVYNMITVQAGIKPPFLRVNISSNWKGYIPVLIQTKSGFPFVTFYSVLAILV